MSEQTVNDSKKVRIPSPLKKGVATVPVVLQMQLVECGAASLCMVLAYYRKWLPLEKVSFDCGVSRDGSTAKSIAVAARSYGLEVHAYSMAASALRQNATFPCIIYWEHNHFMVLDGIRGKTVVLNDPASGRMTMPMEDFERGYSNVCITFKPTEAFVPEGKKKNMLKYTFNRLARSKESLIFVAMCTLLLSLLGLMSPVFTRIFYDRLLKGTNPEWFIPVMVAFVIFILVRLLLEFVQAKYKTRIIRKMQATGSAEYMWHVLRLPMTFFSQRLAGDVIGRKNTNSTIENTMLDTIAPLGLSFIMMVVYLIIMIRYSVTLTVAGILAMLLSLVVSRVTANIRENVTRKQLRDIGQADSMMLSGIDAIETIKSSGAEAGYFQSWAGIRANINVQESTLLRLQAYIGNIPQIISALLDAVVLLLGIYLILKGHFTAGSLVAFQGLLSSFTSPASELIDARDNLQEMNTMIERIDDVMRYPEDPMLSARPDEADQGKTLSKLSGSLELKNVTFGYNPLGRPIIRDFSATLKPGSRVAFVGMSGSGKSTLANLITGLHKPWEGEILFDGKPIDKIDHSVFTASVAMVDQEITLFEDTITNNITMWDNTIEDYEVILAARDAQIHSVVLQHDGGYDYGVSEGGRDFSGGQRQCLEIARVLAQDPTIMILDEATSALDAQTEFNVMKAIKDRGITCVVIAHRLSTIRDCDEIIVLDHGVVVERGRHEELMALNGTYAKMVASD